jgi:hypothetical protein
MRGSHPFVLKGMYMSSFSVERLDHLEIVAGVCQEMGFGRVF